MRRVTPDDSPLPPGPSLAFLLGAPKKDGLGLEVEGVEEGGLIRGPALLMIDCWQTSNAVWIHPYSLYDSTPSFINPKLAK